MERDPNAKPVIRSGPAAVYRIDRAARPGHLRPARGARPLMSFGDYLAGSIELIAVAASIGFAAVGLRGRLLPGWSGASARLAEVVLGHLPAGGDPGADRRRRPLPPGLGPGRGADRRARDRLRRCGAPSEGFRSRRPQVAPIALGVAVAGALLVAAHWAMPTQTGLDIGMYLPNTTWHNAPFAARFVQDHQVGALHFTEVLRLTVWFYPQNSELLHSAGVLFLGNDFLSPLINIGWMALCLLAAWSFGRPYGAGAAALLGVALVVDANMLLLYQPGDAKNDIAGPLLPARLGGDPRQRRGAAACGGRSARPIAAGRAAVARASRPSGEPLGARVPLRRAGAAPDPPGAADRRRARGRPGARHQAQPARAVRACSRSA